MPNPGPATTISTHQLLQADSSDGYLIGSLSTTPIGMYGVTPVAQRSNAAQLTVSAVATSGLLVGLQTAGLTPAAVGGLGGNTQVLLINTAAPVGWQIGATDYVIANKPSAQGNIALTNVRTNGSSAGLVVAQYLTIAGSTTPTAAEAYTMAVFKGIASTVTLSPAAVPASSTLEQQFNVTGVSVGQIVAVTKPSEQQGLAIAGARVVSNNVLGITFLNVSTVALTPVASEAYTYVASAGYAANSNLVLYGLNMGSFSGPMTSGATTQSWGVSEANITVSTIVTSDILLSVNKPTNQQEIALLGAKISAASVVSMAFGRSGPSGVTPTVGEIYSTLIYRPNPQPPLVLLNVTCTPSAIGGSQMAEQAFTVTPVAASSVVWVNKPTFTNGIGIVGCRVSAAGVVAIQFVNSLISTTVTPPAEVYVFGNVQPVPNATHQVAMQVGNGLVGTNAQANELRLALTNIGAITGGTP